MAELEWFPWWIMFDPCFGLPPPWAGAQLELSKYLRCSCCEVEVEHKFGDGRVAWVVGLADGVHISGMVERVSWLAPCWVFV